MEFIALILAFVCCMLLAFISTDGRLQLSAGLEVASIQCSSGPCCPPT